MSNADKRAAVVAELKAHPDESDNKIAQRLGVHNETVTSARRQLTESVTTPQIPAQERQNGTLAAQSPRSAETKIRTGDFWRLGPVA